MQTCSTGWSFHGFYTGPTSIAYLFYRLSLLYPEAEFKHQSHREWAQVYLDLGARAPQRAPAPAHCGIGNETLARLALTAVLGEDADAARQLCAYAGAINAGAEDGSNEWLYGRAGYLYFLRLCRSVLRGGAAASLLDQTMEQTVDRMLAVPQPWTWRGREYVGAAHGTAGIVCQMVLAVPRAAPRLRTWRRARPKYALVCGSAWRILLRESGVDSVPRRQALAAATCLNCETRPVKAPTDLSGRSGGSSGPTMACISASVARAAASRGDPRNSGRASSRRSSLSAYSR